MFDDIQEITKKTITDRLSNPLLGYIALSWLACNWSNIAFLLMSKLEIEKRILTILTQPNLWTDYFWTPIITGVTFFIFIPYVQWGLSLSHNWIIKKKKESEIQALLEKYQDDVNIADKKVEAETAIDKAKALKQKEFSEIEEEIKQLPFKTDSLKLEYEQLVKSIEILKTKTDEQNIANGERLSKESKELEEIKMEHEELLSKTKIIIKTYKEHEKLDNIEDANLFLDKINKTISEVESSGAFSRYSTIKRMSFKVESNTKNSNINIRDFALQSSSATRLLHEINIKPIAEMSYLGVDKFPIHDWALKQNHPLNLMKELQLESANHAIRTLEAHGNFFSKIPKSTMLTQRDINGNNIKELTPPTKEINHVNIHQEKS